MTKELAYKIPLVFEPQPEGGYTVTCPILPEWITEGDTIAEALANVEGALTAIIEAYEDLNRPLPPVLERVVLDLHTPFGSNGGHGIETDKGDPSTSIRQLSCSQEVGDVDQLSRSGRRWVGTVARGGHST